MRKKISVRVKLSVPPKLFSARVRCAVYGGQLTASAEWLLDNFGLSTVLIGRDAFGQVRVIECQCLNDATDMKYDVE